MFWNYVYLLLSIHYSFPTKRQGKSFQKHLVTISTPPLLNSTAIFYLEAETIWKFFQKMVCDLEVLTLKFSFRGLLEKEAEQGVKYIYPQIPFDTFSNTQFKLE